MREQKPKRQTRRKTVKEKPTKEAPPDTIAEVAADNAPDPGADAPDDEYRMQEAFELVLSTIDGMLAERGEDERIWGSMVKQTLKRRHPGFNESYYGFRSFNKLLEEAEARRLLTLELDEKSGGYLVRPTGN